MQVVTSSVLTNKLDLESSEQIISCIQIAVAHEVLNQTSESSPFDTRAYRSKRQTHAVRQRQQQDVLE
jgi:hypothetical protein